MKMFLLDVVMPLTIQHTAQSVEQEALGLLGTQLYFETLLSGDIACRSSIVNPECDSISHFQ